MEAGKASKAGRRASGERGKRATGTIRANSLQLTPIARSRCLADLRNGSTRWMRLIQQRSSGAHLLSSKAGEQLPL